MSALPACPQCQSEFAYEDRGLYICPECGHEWPADAQTPAEEAAPVVRDAHGNELNAGDNVTLIKDLKVKGSSSVIKVGTKVKILRLVEGDHDIDCRIDGFGGMMLKSEFVKKAGQAGPPR
ncbi:MAG: zinc ribbon domain-containing protein YjdM [Trichloromonas sp.]|nr:zinc ribbon domain-containing protein YjdM [Trichloromonas sp.]